MYHILLTFIFTIAAALFIGYVIGFQAGKHSAERKAMRMPDRR